MMIQIYLDISMSDRDQEPEVRYCVSCYSVDYPEADPVVQVVCTVCIRDKNHVGGHVFHSCNILCEDCANGGPYSVFLQERNICLERKM